MREIKSDSFDIKSVDAVCILTSFDQVYMSDERWPETKIRLGKCIKNLGTNVPFVIGALDGYGKYFEPNLRIIKQRGFKTLIFSFPIMNDVVDGISLEVVESSANELKILVERFNLRNVVLPELPDDAKTIVDTILDNRFIICKNP